MDWFRVYHGIATDPKLHKASRLAKISRGLMLGAWVATLEFASQQHERGSVGDLDPETLAYLIDQPVSVATRIFDAMRTAHLVVENRIVAWENRQRASDDVASRVRSFRAKSAEFGSSRVKPFGADDEPHRKPLPAKETAPPSNVTETRQNRAEQNREDSVKTESLSPPQPAQPVSRPKRDPSHGSRLPADWRPTEDGIRFAQNLGMNAAAIGYEIGRFQDHWGAKAGKEARKLSWDAAWRNWCRTAADIANRNRMNGQSPVRRKPVRSVTGLVSEHAERAGDLPEDDPDVPFTDSRRAPRSLGASGAQVGRGQRMDFAGRHASATGPLLTLTGREVSDDRDLGRMPALGRG